MKPTPTYQKLRGGYYTPKPIADFLARWAIRSRSCEILEPSCGDGILLESALETLVGCGAAHEDAVKQVHGVEIDSVEAAKAAARVQRWGGLLTEPGIHVGDFFGYCRLHLSDKRLFDAIIGNPPFIRYQSFPEEYRSIAFELMHDAGLHPNRLTNAWVPFLVATTLLLNQGGRMAMVVPAELLQVNYAAELRSFLSDSYSALTLVTFKKLVFEGIQQEVVLLLGERNGHDHTGIRVIELNKVDDLASYQQVMAASNHLKEMDHSAEKWTMYFLAEDELQLLRRLRSHPGLTRSGQIIDVDVGVVTGQNKYFVLDGIQVSRNALKSYTQPIVGRSVYLPGAVFSQADWQASVEKQAPAYLFVPPAVAFDELPEAVKKYVRIGELSGIQKGYKCRIRKQWYVVPSVWTPAAFMLRQVHAYPKIIVNEAGATATDTIHRVRSRNGADIKIAAAAFLNRLTFAFSEITGRSYGGGVLELEPNEAERLPIPLSGADQLDLADIDALLRKNDIHSVLQITDRVLLQDGLGLDESEVQKLGLIWEKLRDRRHNRKHR